MINADDSVTVGRKGNLAESTLLISNSGPTRFSLFNSSGPHGWKLNVNNSGDLKFVYTADVDMLVGQNTLTLKSDGSVVIEGDLTVMGTLTHE